jgi:copper chaperone CopZ
VRTDYSGYATVMYRAQCWRPLCAPFMWTRIAALLVCAACAANTARAEFLHMEVFIRDMNCESCSATLAGSLQRMRGVEKAEVDFKAGTVRLELAEKNRIGVEQVWDAIKRVGFTPGETTVSLRGALKASKLEVPEIGKTFEIQFRPGARAPEGDSVELTGVITPPPDPRTPIVIRGAIQATKP